MPNIIKFCELGLSFNSFFENVFLTFGWLQKGGLQWCKCLVFTLTDISKK